MEIQRRRHTHKKTCANDSTHTATENCNGGTATCQQKATCNDCGEQYGEFSKHVYDKENADAIYLKSAATCTQKAVYYKSCSCGEKGTETFEYGELLPHTFSDDKSGWCTTCDQFIKASEGVVYQVSVDGQYAEVIDYVGTATRIRIADTYNALPVKNITSLRNKDTLTCVIIPDSVTTIGYEAFEGCSSLTSVTIGNSVTSIGGGAFYGCSNLTSITIPDSVTTIGYEAFEGCSSLTSVTIGNSVTSIGGGAFYNCRSLTSVTIPNSVTSIGNEAFRNCSSLTSVTIPNSVTSIGNEAFRNCYKLIEVINKSALKISKSTKENGYVAYYALHVHNATSKIVNKDGFLFVTNEDNVNYLLGYNGTATELTLPNDYNGKAYEIYKYAFYNCSSLTSVTIGNSVTSIGDSAFYGCSSLTSVNYTGTIDQWVQIDFNIYFSNPLYYAGKLYINNQLVTEAKITTATEISGSAFYNCRSLTSVMIGNSVTSIGSSAFGGCTSLTSVTIPNSVTSIGDSAFYGCSNLTSITISDGVTSIGDYAFYGCSNLTSITISDSVTSIGIFAFYGCSSLTSVTIGNSVTSIGSSAFYNCSSLTSVNYTGMIDQWVQIDFLDFSNPLYYAGKLYINNQLVTEAKITTATEISGSAFYNCSSLTSVTIENSVTSIGYQAFYNCSSLMSVTIPDSVTSIGDSAFYNCSSLTSITIPDSVTSIGNSAFEGCSNLTSVTIPDSVTSIGHEAFYNCSSLKIVYYEGTAEQWSNVEIGNNNGLLNPVTVYYYSAEAPKDKGNYWHYDSAGNAVEWQRVA